MQWTSERRLLSGCCSCCRYCHCLVCYKAPRDRKVLVCSCRPPPCSVRPRSLPGVQARRVE
eukprot:91152-Hanusia_phi.AAC.5